jgi:hypothetical protein
VGGALPPGFLQTLRAPLYPTPPHNATPRPCFPPPSPLLFPGDRFSQRRRGIRPALSGSGPGPSRAMRLAVRAAASGVAKPALFRPAGVLFSFACARGREAARVLCCPRLDAADGGRCVQPDGGRCVQPLQGLGPGPSWCAPARLPGLLLNGRRRHRGACDRWAASCRSPPVRTARTRRLWRRSPRPHGRCRCSAARPTPRRSAP